MRSKVLAEIPFFAVVTCQAASNHVVKEVRVLSKIVPAVTKVWWRKHLKDYDKAIADHTQSLGLNPKDRYVYFNRGTTFLLHTGQVIDGLQDIYRGFRLQPSYGLKLFGPWIVGVIITLVTTIWKIYFDK